MSYTAKQYAEMAAQANATGRLLVVVDGEMTLQDPPPPTLAESIKAQIAALEAAQTARMVRGAALGKPDDVARLAAIEAEIAPLREQIRALEET